MTRQESDLSLCVNVSVCFCLCVCEKDRLTAIVLNSLAKTQIICTDMCMGGEWIQK